MQAERSFYYFYHHWSLLNIWWHYTINMPRSTPVVLLLAVLRRFWRWLFFVLPCGCSLRYVMFAVLCYVKWILLLWKMELVACKEEWFLSCISGQFCYVTKTYLHNFNRLKPHFYIVKLGFTGVYVIFIIFAQKHRLVVLLIYLTLCYYSLLLWLPGVRVKACSCSMLCQ